MRRVRCPDYRAKIIQIIRRQSGRLSGGWRQYRLFRCAAVIALHGDLNLGAYMLANVAYVVLEATVAYYIIARGQFTPRESLIKLLRLPLIYAVAAGVMVSFSGWSLPEWSQPLFQNAQGAYVMLGMMVIGLSLAQLQKFEMDFRIFGFAFAGKIIMFFIAAAIIYWDRDLNYLGSLNRDILRVVTLVPFAGNAVSYAAEVGVHPEKAATVVFASTLCALLYIPLAFALLN